jgi:hypothetical protein
VFAIPISLPIAVLLGPSCIVVMALLVLVMFSPEQLIIAADAGPVANATAAAVTNANFIEKSSQMNRHIYRLSKNEFVGFLLHSDSASGTASHRRAALAASQIVLCMRAT